MMAMAYDTYAPQSVHQYVHYEGFTYMAERRKRKLYDWVVYADKCQVDKGILCDLVV